LTVTRDEVQRWLDRYVEAWRSYDEAVIGDLFAEDAEYRYHPWDDPLAGRAAIVESWTAPENRDEPGAWTAEYRPWAVDGDRAVATGISRYDDRQGRREYHNVFLITFDGDGRCASFTEVYLKRQ
jgi:ketosteroid isomerase-like protein